MAERHDPARDLVAELRRVDDAFAGLKTGRSDVIERLVAGDTDELVRQSARRHRRHQLQQAATVVGAFALAVATVVAVRLVPTDHAGAIAVTTLPSTSPSMGVPSTSPSMGVPATNVPSTNVTSTNVSSSVPATNGPSTNVSVVVTAPTPTLRRLPAGRVAVTGEHGALAAMGATELQPLTPSPSSSPSTPNAMPASDVAAVGVAAPVVLEPATIADDDIDGALRTARRLAARGDFDGGAATLTALLEREPPARVVDTVTLEQARLLRRAGRHDEACAALDSHRSRFPASDNAVVVDAERSRWSCP